MKIYIVEGVTGEYSDRSDWAVCAYHSKEKADDHVRFAMLRAMEISKKYRASNRLYSSYDENRERNEFDENMQIDYTGTEYYTVEVELKD